MILFELRNDILEVKVIILALYNSKAEDLYQGSLLPTFEFERGEEYPLSETHLFEAKEELYKKIINNINNSESRSHSLTMIGYYDSLQSILKENRASGWRLTVYIEK